MSIEPSKKNQIFTTDVLIIGAGPDGRFFYYPIRLFDTLLKLGLLESARALVSYIQSRLFPYAQEENFEEWVSNRFGRRLYEIFFKTYTEKVWGIPYREIKAEWAAQRIKGLSLLVRYLIYKQLDEMGYINIIIRITQC